MAFDPSTKVGKVRLLISDNGERGANPSEFQDAEIEAFLAMKGGNIFLAASQALLTIADDDARLARRESSLQSRTDRRTASNELRQLAASLESHDDDSDFDVAYQPLVDGAAEARLDRPIVIENSSYVWRGFKSAWTTRNHRWNRHGDIAIPGSCDAAACSAVVTHTAASGTAADDMNWQSFGYFVKTPSAAFQRGSLTFRIHGSEDVTYTRTIYLNLQLAEGLKNRGKLNALLGGFDVLSHAIADKPVRFSVGIGTPSLINGGNNLLVPVSVVLNMACHSIECAGSDSEGIDYSVKVEILVVAGDAGLHITTEGFATDYAWNRRDEVSTEGTISGTIPGEPGFNAAFVAFKTIEMTLDEEHWMFGWHSFVGPQTFLPPFLPPFFDFPFYEPATGKYQYRGRLQFKPWSDNMAFGAIKKAGRVSFSGVLALVQLQSGIVRLASTAAPAILSWDGGGASADAPESIQNQTVTTTW